MLSANGITADTGGNPLDMALSAGSTYLYALTADTREIRAYQVHADGSLTPVPGATGLVMGSTGLATR